MAKTNKRSNSGDVTMKLRKLAYGGTYQPVGYPTSPVDIRSQKQELRKEEGNFWTGLKDWGVNYVLPMVASAVGGPGAGALFRGIADRAGHNPSNSQLPTYSDGQSSPAIDYVDPNQGDPNSAYVAYGGKIKRCATGGPLDPPLTMYMPTVTPDLGINSTATVNPNIVPNIRTPLPDLMGDAARQAAMSGGFKGSSRKVHGSQDRYRERADGGPLQQDSPYNNTASQFDYLSSGRRNSTSSPRGTEESGKSILSKGSKGEEVTMMQDFLRAKGFYKGEVDGIFGSKTEAAVKAYQRWFNDNAKYPVSYNQDGQPTLVGPKAKKVKVDGIVGDETRAALMYREMPKPTYIAPPAEVPSPNPTTDRQYTTTDTHPNAGPVVMDYPGGLLMGALALSGFATGAAMDASAIGAATNLTRFGVEPGRTPSPRAPLNPNVPNNPGNPGPRSFPPKTPSSYGTRIGYAEGGDLPLSSDSFMVNGNPNVRDSESYHTPEGTLKLDDQEVIKGDFAFSNRIKNPMTANTFAKDAKPLARAIGKAEKKLTLNKGDLISRNTIDLTEKRSENLAHTQEVVATLMGKRNQPQAAYADGGPVLIDPARSYYYDSTKDQILWKNESGGYSTVVANPDVNEWPQVANYRKVPDWSSAPGTPGQVSNPDAWNSNPGVPVYPVTGNRIPQPPVAPIGKRGPGNPMANSNEAFYQKYPGARPYYPGIKYSNPFSALPLQPVPTASPADYAGVVPANADARPKELDQLAKVSRNAPSVSGPRTGGQGDYGSTVGDLLQMIEVGSKFAQLSGGPEKDPYHQDNTPITQQTYDVSPLLQQNQATFQNQVNSLDTSSVNLRRAVASQLYAKKLETDSSIMNQYQNLNNQAQTQFQDRVSNQRRSNIGLQMATEDINARNRGQYNNAVQNAFTSLGNFGEAVNQKKQAYNALNILRTIYPDVYSRVINSANGAQ